MSFLLLLLPKGNKRKAYHECDMPTGQPFRPKKESPVERILIGLPDMAITKVESLAPCVLQVQWKGGRPLSALWQHGASH